ncbi:hypothetical protein AGABI2DRAFT_178785 [Agaricus bisporus var. bisporus H97]|uniref:hypothetical protein n=1 Tax=Agaricus bisporus var. bisporus (strain H97 / ATCC MYA-4626 / FGSC 10389) TaxID=936046 RepID=UPI00029F5FB6|nr:hypothetical protein AGABI2DRAFT_178785 [Agaricus bisporus var. bisporus H97]EKV46432.1 hypothetical protein AGABI2DRAFT_178785 [Agaricus bisporus var. bisporus H97]
MSTMDITQKLFILRLTCGICAGVAILTTFIRFTVRIVRKNRLWVDDAFTVVSASALVTQLAGVCLDPARHGVVRGYLLSNMFYLAIWSSRLSILFSLIRITRNLRPTRMLYVFAVLFFLAWAFLTAQLFWICESQKGWKEKPIPQCTLGTVVAVCQIVSDVISDSILLITPIRTFMVITDRKLRYRAMIIFGTCIVTTIVSLVHAAYLFQHLDTSILISAFVENSASLIVCNIPIMVTAVVKLQERRAAQSTARSRSIPLFHKPPVTQPTGFSSTTTDIKLSHTISQQISTSTSITTEGHAKKEDELITDKADV